MLSGLFDFILNRLLAQEWNSRDKRMFRKEGAQIFVTRASRRGFRPTGLLNGLSSFAGLKLLKSRSNYEVDMLIEFKMTNSNTSIFYNTYILSYDII